MGRCDLWFHDDSSVPPYVNWYQSKYLEHSYDPTILATRKIQRHDCAHKTNNRDKSCSSDYSKHVHKSPGHSYDSTIRRKKKLLQKDELRQTRLKIFWATLDAYHMPSIDLEYQEDLCQDKCTTQEEKQMTLCRKKRSLQKEEQRQARLEIFWTIQDDYHVLSIDPEYPEEYVVPEMDKMPILDHTEAAEDLVSPDPSSAANPPDVIASIPDGDKVLSLGDLALITSPPDFISPIVDDQRVEEVHVPSHHYAGDPHLHDITWCEACRIDRCCSLHLLEA